MKGAAWEKPKQNCTLDNERIRGHSQLQGEHQAFEKVLGQLRDLLGEDLADEGDELVVLVAQRGELGGRSSREEALTRGRCWWWGGGWRKQRHVGLVFTFSRS